MPVEFSMMNSKKQQNEGAESLQPLVTKDIEHIAHLARLALSEDEKTIFTDQMGEILTYVRMLGEVSTDSIEATFSVMPLQNVFREDIVQPSPGVDLLENAPLREEGYIKMPKILSQE
jgi:aspartyl-tRNA(Asn)/glutamyl-tRNA(Gln) amidotransferase subunit C